MQRTLLGSLGYRRMKLRSMGGDERRDLSVEPPTPVTSGLQLHGLFRGPQFARAVLLINDMDFLLSTSDCHCSARATLSLSALFADSLFAYPTSA